MLKLLPHRFKTIGAFAAPLGFIFWLLMQWGYVSKLGSLLGLSNTHYLNVAVALIGFFSFLFGTYLLTFSKEKVEDEMINKVRLESFQFSAIVQLIFIILGFLLMIIIGEPKEGGMMLFFIAAVLIFWLSYILRFNYIVHVSIFKYEK